MQKCAVITPHNWTITCRVSPLNSLKPKRSFWFGYHYSFKLNNTFLMLHRNEIRAKIVVIKAPYIRLLVWEWTACISPEEEEDSVSFRLCCPAC